MAERLAASTLNGFMDVAGRVADAAGAVLTGYFRSSIGVDTKDDASPVTVADREAEAAMRAVLEAAHPDHGVLGEELEATNPGAEWVWVLDPIDGTKSFISGKPLFGSLVALTRGGKPVVGIIDHPALGERWCGVRDGATTFNGAPARARGRGRLSEAVLHATSPRMFLGADGDAFDRLCGAVGHTVYGGDCYNYGLLASGHTDLVVEADLKAYDFAALVPVVEGAGGVITDWQGDALTLASDGRVVAAANAAIHAEALSAMAGR